MKLNLKLLTLFALSLFLISPNNTQAYCGDGVIQTDAEQCDDGNFDAGDGCSAYCQIEDTIPPEVTSVSIANGATGISTRTKSIVIYFSEEVDKSTVNKANIKLVHLGEELDYDVEPSTDGKSATITINQNLYSKASHAVKARYVRDLTGNYLTDENKDDYFISAFETAEEIDDKAPTVIINPKGGDFNFTQQVSIKAYIGDYTNSDEFLDDSATIYYTVNDYQIEENKQKYKGEIKLEDNATIRFFAIDGNNNKTPIYTERYNFKCPEFPNAKQVVNNYPECKIIECENSFVLRGNSCAVNLGTNDPSDYKSNAATAPLLPSDKPMYITTKPAIYITKDHKGVIPRPLIFQDEKRGISIEFEKGTKILDSQARPFSGYIKPPENLYSKDFPINFGYSFKSIFSFKSADGEDLQFQPPYKITIPYTETFENDEPVRVFNFDDETEKYSEYSRSLYKSDIENQNVIISSYRTGRFFIAQEGKNFNRSVFTDIETHWAKNYIESLYRKGIVNGKDKGIYAPNDYLTRAEFIKITLKSIGAEVQPIDEYAESPFKDVPLFSWYASYISKAKELDLIKGYEDGTFKPDQNINRAEAIKILFSAFNFDLSYRPESTDEPSSNERTRYIDLKRIEWYYPYAEFAIENDVMKGTASIGNAAIRYFYPALPISRAEMAKIAIKTMELKELIDQNN